MVWKTADGATFTRPGHPGSQKDARPSFPNGEVLIDLSIPGPLGYHSIAAREPSAGDVGADRPASQDLARAPLAHALLNAWSQLFLRKLWYQGRKLLLVAGDDVHELAEADAYEVLDQDQARRILMAMAADPGNQGEFAELLQRTQAVLAPDWRSPGMPHGLVLLRRRPTPSIRNIAHRPAITPSEMRALVAEAALEIHVVDLNGRPQVGLAFRINKPDGGSESDKLDKDGRGRAKSGSTGIFTVTFPDLDGADWDGDGAEELPPEEERSEASQYEVKQGDRLPTIARKTGFARWQTIWDFAGNAALKDLRGNANVLLPRDQISIPSKVGRVAEVEGGTAEYVVQSEAEVLRVRFAEGDFGGKRKIRFRATPDRGAPAEGPLEADGTMEIILSPEAMKVDVDLLHDGEDAPFVTCTLEVGHLDPDAVTSGIQARLANLGYYAGPIDGQMNDATRDAVIRFRLTALGDELDAIDDHLLKALGKAHRV